MPIIYYSAKSLGRMTNLHVLIACEESQAECIAFRELGCLAYSCDIQPCRRDGHPEWHILGDVTALLDGETTFRTMDGEEHCVPRWDLIVAHPPCTYLCKCGSPWLRKDANFWAYAAGRRIYVNEHRWFQLQAARQFFFKCLRAHAYYVAVENPLPMAAAELPPASCFVDPSWYGVKYSKKTLYWLRGLPAPMAEYIYPNPKCYVRASRGKYRSRTFPALARAIARQWVEFIQSDLDIWRAL